MKKILFITLFFMISCNITDKREHYYYLPSYDALDVGYPYGSIIYKGLQEYSFSDIILTANVLDCKQTSQFVTAKQRLDKKLLKKWIRDRIKGFLITKGYGGDRKELKFYDVVLPDTLLLKYNASDSSIKELTNFVLNSPSIQRLEQNTVNYWIIKKSIDSIIGPLTKKEFKMAKKNLKLPGKLKLD